MPFHNEALGKLILRLTVGILILFHGADKITHPARVDYIASALSASGFPSMLAYGVYLGEVIAPLMLIFGIFTRYGAIIIVINMVFAIMLMHMNHVFAITEHGGWRLELQGLFLFGAFAIVFLGSGRYAFKAD